MSDHIVQRVDTAIHVTGLLVRAALYGVVGSLADRFDFGQAILTGVLLGDLVASLAALLWHGREHWAQLIAELALLGLIYLWLRNDLVWPPEPAMRAIMALAAFGMFASRAGGSILTRLGPSENGFA